jgi:hypothetical protein
MGPEDFAEKHPRLYHLTDPDAQPSIMRLGLLPTSTLLTLFEVGASERPAYERRRRRETMTLSHPAHGTLRIADNLPLTENALTTCLDDGLTPEDWLLMLNARVFFWPDVDNLVNHRSARSNRGRDRLVLVFDTLKLARAHADRMELTPINTGSTIRKPARRGLSTFTPMLAHSYLAWRKLRGGNDAVREVTALGGVPDIAPFLVESYLSSPRNG